MLESSLHLIVLTLVQVVLPTLTHLQSLLQLELLLLEYVNAFFQVVVLYHQVRDLVVLRHVRVLLLLVLHLVVQALRLLLNRSFLLLLNRGANEHILQVFKLVLQLSILKHDVLEITLE